ncbi:MAG TPA: carboxypeptidase regulatory-like domain-containing protein [Kofleriaceae bacterium]|nr:carboxypeptidase regulatory-like domain-containing protein [Kofleriaceae bacterium]
MSPRIALCAVLALLPPAAAAGLAGGTITGHVNRVKNRTLMNQDAWVYLVQVAPHRRHAPTAHLPPREIRQQMRAFVPHAMVVALGTEVAFPNYDTIEHNVFSPSEPPGEWDLGRYNHDLKGRTRVFDDEGEIEIYCDIHKEMWARILVVDTDPSLIAKVDDAGNYTFTGLPPGTYEVHAWTYASAEPGRQRVTLTAGQTQHVDDLNIQLGELAASHLRKDGSAYTVGYP